MNVIHSVDPCMACGRVHGRITYSGPERRHAPDERITVGRFAVLIVVALIMWAAIIAAWIWALTR